MSHLFLGRGDVDALLDQGRAEVVAAVVESEVCRQTRHLRAGTAHRSLEQPWSRLVAPLVAEQVPLPRVTVSDVFRDHFSKPLRDRHRVFGAICLEGLVAVLEPRCELAQERVHVGTLEAAELAVPKAGEGAEQDCDAQVFRECVVERPDVLEFRDEVKSPGVV